MLAALVGIVVLANELRQTAENDDAATVHLAQLNEVSQTVSRLSAGIQEELARSMVGQSTGASKIRNVVVAHTADIDKQLWQMADYAPEAALDLKQDISALVSTAVQAVEAYERGDDGAGETRLADLRRLVDRLDVQLREVSTALAVQSAESNERTRKREETIWNSVLAVLLGSAVVAAGLCVAALRDDRAEHDEPGEADAVLAQPLPLPVPANAGASLNDDQVRQFAMALRGYFEDRDRRRIVDRVKAAAETRYGALLEAGRIGALRIVGDRLEDANDAFATMLGYPDVPSLLEAHGTSGTSAFADQDAIQKMLAEVGNKGAVHGVPLRLVGAHGATVFTLMSGYAIANGGRPRCELLALDVTEANERETRMKSALEEARYADRAKSEFLANISHELRTPLNAIIGFSEVLLDRSLRPRNPDTVEEYLGDIRESGLHLLSLVSDLLDVSRIEAGRTDLREEELDLADIADSAIRMVRRQATEGGVRIGFAGDRSNCLLRADRRAVKQILVNLLSNAVKFTPSGGSVAVRCDSRPDGALDVLVTDTGVGISEEDIPLVLERFGQVNGTPRVNGEGTGLGLPLAQALVKLHGGELTINSRPDAGTTVRVHFPAERRVRQTALGMV